LCSIHLPSKAIPNCRRYSLHPHAAPCEYRYFAHPLPDAIAALRRNLYRQLVSSANEWKTGVDYPATHEEFLERCAAAGQLRPTQLLLRYREGDHNCLHQDLYGEVYFPFQVVIALSAAGEEYSGGELVLVEQQPRAQSIARVVPLAQGDGAVIATRYRLGRNARGRTFRANIRHGVSAVRSASGSRWASSLTMRFDRRPDLRLRGKKPGAFRTVELGLLN
jgi:uncharacterized protein